jgi:hypothetical protein
VGRALAGAVTETLTFQPFLSMNDYAGLATALLAGTVAGISETVQLRSPKTPSRRF